MTAPGWTWPLLEEIRDEATAPTCASYEYDPTPTAEERLKRILALCNQGLERTSIEPPPPPVRIRVVTSPDSREGPTVALWVIENGTIRNATTSSPLEAKERVEWDVHHRGSAMNASDCRPGARVRYQPVVGPDEPSFSGIVREDPWLLGHGRMVTHLCGMEAAYGEHVGRPGKTTVHGASLEALELEPTIVVEGGTP